MDSMDFVSEPGYLPKFATFESPEESIKIKTVSPKIPPEYGDVFNPGQVIKLTFPSQGYLNPACTTISFDVTLYGAKVTTAGIHVDSDNSYNIISPQIRFQNNIQSIFERVRIMYGSLPLEDLLNYNQLVRCKTEWYKSHSNNVITNESINEGIGGILNGVTEVITGYAKSIQSIRSRFIQGLCGTTDLGYFAHDGCNTPNSIGGIEAFSDEIGTWACTKSYEIKLDGSGLLNQSKLLPLKFMASQLSIEITLAEPKNCIFVSNLALSSEAIGTGTAPVFTIATADPLTYALNPTYAVSNIRLKPEILEFDESYDQMFLKGVRQKGIPIKFNSWNFYRFPTRGGSSFRLNIPDRSKSIRSLVCLQRYGTPTYTIDMHGTVNGSYQAGGTGGFLQSYQYKVGNDYYPAAPVNGFYPGYPLINNGGVGAYNELKKLKFDYETSSNLNCINWGICSNSNLLKDYNSSFRSYSANNLIDLFDNSVSNLHVNGEMPSSQFAACVDLTSSKDGKEICGFDGETSYEIAFIGKYNEPQSNSYEFLVMVNYDSEIILWPNNVLMLIK